MDINVTAGAVTGLTWLWEKYGERVTNICTDSMKEKWTQLHWGDSERKYRARVLDQVSTTLLLGYPKPIKIDNVYTDVHVLDQITAKRRFNFEDLAQKPFDFDGANIRPKRVSAETLLDQSKKIFILGKPGAGKTTFLKYIALLACKGKIAKTPVYVPLKEWSDSGLSILAFIEKQFTVCGFPDAKLFLQSIFNAGEALILLDGLDEVNQEDLARVKMIQELVDLANQYPDCIFCITCRIAATDYTFTQFTYVEIADFNGEQKDSFIQKWYQNEPEKLKLFISEWGKPDNQGFRELAQTPLLLALLCLAFDETLQFAKRRVDLYTEALDALLKKWDSTRGVLRAEVYRRISLPRKKQLLSRIAATNFQKGSYLFPKSVLVAEIEKFLLQLPPDDKTSRPEAEGVLSAIEYQHGLLVERAHGVYSFSHLTFQEYFTALYVVENQAGGTLDRLIDEAMKDQRWREVVLMCASLLHDATVFITTFAEKAWTLISSYGPIVDLLEGALGEQSNSAFVRTEEIGERRITAPAAEWEMMNKDAIDKVTDACLSVAAEYSFGSHDPINPGHLRARNLARMLRSPGSVSSNDFRLIEAFFEKREHTRQFVRYLQVSQLLVEAVRISWLEDRVKCTDLILKPLKRTA